MRVVALLVVVAAAALVAPCVATSPPVFPQSFTTSQTDNLSEFQGQYEQQGSSLCCAPDAQQCKVQVQTQAGVWDIDAPNQRTRFDQFGTDQVIMTFFAPSINKQALVVNGTCTEYCPVDEPFGGFGIDPNATLKGTHPCPGDTSKTCQLWEYKQVILGVIVMEIDQTYVDVSGSTPVPHADVAELTPFGQKIGVQTSIFTNYVAGVPPASKFAVNGLDTCPESPNCGQSSWQMIRLRHKMFNTYAHYAQEKGNLF